MKLSAQGSPEEEFVTLVHTQARSKIARIFGSQENQLFLQTMFCLKLEENLFLYHKNTFFKPNI